MKMRSTLVMAALLCLAVALPGSSALAQEKQQVSFKIPTEGGKYTVSQNVDVGDVSNHIVRLFDIRYTISNDAAIVNGLKLVELFQRGTADLTDGYGGGTGYIVFVAENGDRLFARNNVVAQQASGKLTAIWAGSITGGTGKFAGIHGATRTSANFDPSPGGAVSNLQINIEYSIGK
jgi:hypothetical protein